MKYKFILFSPWLLRSPGKQTESSLENYFGSSVEVSVRH